MKYIDELGRSCTQNTDGTSTCYEITIYQPIIDAIDFQLVTETIFSISALLIVCYVALKSIRLIKKVLKQ